MNTTNREIGHLPVEHPRIKDVLPLTALALLVTGLMVAIAV